MGHNSSLSHEERLEIVEALRKGSLSHHDIAKRFNRAQSTVSKIARDAGITPTHRRKRTPAASEVEGTYDKQARINFEDRFLSALDGMITPGGLSPRDAREVAQAAKVVLDARRSEDVQEPTSDEKADQTMVPLGIGEMAVSPDTPIGRAMLELEEKMNEPGYFEEGREYGAGERTTLD